MVFSEESRFSLSADDQRIRMWKQSGHRSYPTFVVEKYTEVTQGAIFQQDNADSHTTRLSQQYVQGYDVHLWPARSPDPLPIEYFWDVFGR
ncbi:DDE_3 domain-containing protein [Trichonephila clavipes]|nr:DDE_3 domain-containing protein [Trichonephila clavipes]